MDPIHGRDEGTKKKDKKYKISRTKIIRIFIRQTKLE